MSSSSLRVERLKEIEAVLGEPDLSIKEPHSIRWLGLKNDVDVVYASYSSIPQHCQLLQKSPQLQRVCISISLTVNQPFLSLSC